MLAKRKQLEQQISKIKRQLDKLPEGKLVCNLNGPNSKWFRSDGHNKVYIPKAERALAEKLAIKKYLSTLLEDLSHEMRAIDYYLRHHEKYEEKAERMLVDSSELQNLLSPFFSPLSKELDDWMKSPYEHNLIHPEHLNQKVAALHLKLYHAGINLITTYETLEKPLTFEMIELLVNYYFS